MIEIRHRKIKDAAVQVPGSKSYSHRLLIAASLSDGVCRIENCLESEDTLLTLNALKQMGVRIEKMSSGLLVYGCNGKPEACADEIFLGNSGTSMRLLTAVAALGKGTYRLNGGERMRQRPIQDLIDGLKQMKVKIRSLAHTGCPPVEVNGGGVPGGRVDLNCGTSSQYLSALLLIGPYTEKGINIHVTHGPVSRPYIDMTLDVMNRLGIAFKRDHYRSFSVSGRQTYRHGSYAVEPDASQAGYFWAAAAVGKTAVKVMGVTRESRQGDVAFAQILERMGCRLLEEPDGISVIGAPLVAIEADMGNMPDLVPTLAVVAAFAKGTTVIRNVGHLKLKESDRLTAVATELNKMGVEATCSDNGLLVKGGKPHGAEIDTYQDHRIAMSFAVAGLATKGVFIRNEGCVAKSFPAFWEVLDTL